MMSLPVSLPGPMFLLGGLCLGGLCLGVSVQGFSIGVSVWVSPLGSLCLGVSAWESLSRGSLSRGSLSREVSVQGVSVQGFSTCESLFGSLRLGVSVQGGLWRETPRIRKVGSTHPIGMLSCFRNDYVK